MIPFLVIAALILSCSLGAVAQMRFRDDMRDAERYVESLRREMVRAERRANK